MTDLDGLGMAREALEAALDRKAEEPVVLDVSEVSSFADTFILLTGRSDRQDVIGYPGVDDVLA